MAVRLRKLSKELRRPPSELLDVLHSLGFDRYRSADDMLPDLLAERVRKASRKRGPAPPRPVAPAPRPPQARAEAAADLMSALVPGVVPVARAKDREKRSAPAVVDVVDPVVQRDRLATPDQSATVSAGERAEFDADRAALEARRAELDAASAALEARRQVVLAERRALAAERAAADAELDRLEAERLALAELRAAPPLAAPVPELTTLSELLAARGLMGADEHERALGALASARVLRDALGALRVVDAKGMERLLADHLVLVAGAPPEILPPGVQAVAVAPARAELPGAEELRRLMARAGELLLLNGLRRVAVAGGRPRWQRALREGLDARIELRFVPARSRTRSDAESDVARTDGVLLWAVDVDQGAREVYAGSRAIVIECADDGLVAGLRAICAALDES